jgi:hypothetical protein
MCAFNIHGLFACLVKGLDPKNNHLFFGVDKQPIDVLYHHILVTLVDTQLDAFPSKLDCIFFNTLSMSLSNMTPLEFLFFCVSHR